MTQTIGKQMVFNATINNNSVKSWWPVLLVDETVVSRENHRPVTSRKKISLTTANERIIFSVNLKSTTTI
jgi:hypothetical protein